MGMVIFAEAGVDYVTLETVLADVWMQPQLWRIRQPV